MKENAKKYYYSLQLEEIEKIKKLDHRPTLLMHTCCGICVSYPALYLSEYFDLTLFYCNDNIYPESEYEKRYNELVRLIDIFNSERSTAISIIRKPYEGPAYLKKLEAFGPEKEGGARCSACYSMRLDEGMKYAAENGYDYFTTVMTVSRQKDSIRLNRIGEQLNKQFPATRYFFSDFKKDGGNMKSDQIANSYNVYRQNYCGCLYSLLEARERESKHAERSGGEI